MRHSPWHRAFIGIWGLWFTAALTDAAGIHTCAMHGGAVGHAAASHEGHHAAASHGGAPRDKDASVCTCLGACCCAPAVTAPPGSVALPVPSIVEVVVAEHRDATAPVVRRAHALPFANGPPGVAPTL